MIISEDKYLLLDRSVNQKKYHIKKILCIFQSVWFKLKMLLFRPNNTAESKKYKISICAIFRDEATILKEWIEYHRIVGVSHFYLYNNFSEDNYLEILKPYIDDDIITLIDWPYKQAQMAAYQDCVDRFKNETKWIGFIDLDEFVVPNKHYDNIYSFLKQFDSKRPIVIMYWRYFGSSGKIERDRTKLIIEDFTSCWYKYANIGKFFYNTDYDYNPSEKFTTGYMHYRWGAYRGKNLPPVNVFDKCVLRNVHIVPNDEMPIQINHYLLKSYNEYMEKKAKRGGGVHAIQKGFHDNEYFFRHDSLCQSTDYHIFKYLIKLKLALGLSK